MCGFLQHWLLREGSGETLTAAGGKELLGKMRELELEREATKEQQQQPGKSK